MAPKIKMTEAALKKQIEKNIRPELRRHPIFSEVSFKSNLLEAKLKEMKTRQETYLRTVGVERRPEKLTRDVVARLYQNDLTQWHWARANQQERLNMLRTAADIMAQEMLLPAEVREKLQVKVDNLGDGVNGATNKFVHIDDNKKASITSAPTITLSQQRMMDDNCVNAFSTLFHEMNHVMQFVSVTEDTPWTENVEYWRENIENYVGGSGSYIDYVTGPMEAYAHAQTALFEKVYNAQFSEPIILRAKDIPDSAEAPSFAAEISFTSKSDRLSDYQNELRHQTKLYSEATKWINYYSAKLKNPPLAIGGKPDFSAINGFQSELKKWEKEAKKYGHAISILNTNIYNLTH